MLGGPAVGASLDNGTFLSGSLGRGSQGEREREQKQLIWLLAILTTTTSDPDEGFIYLYIYTHTPFLSPRPGALASFPPRPCKSCKTLQIYGQGENVSRCGIVATWRGKQTSGTSLEAVCDRASVGKQPEVLFQAGMMSFQREQHCVIQATWMNAGCIY